MHQRIILIRSCSRTATDSIAFELGGRPLAVRYSKNGDRVFVVNSLLNAIQVVDVGARRIEQTIPLGESSPKSLARREK